MQYEASRCTAQVTSDGRPVENEAMTLIQAFSRAIILSHVGCVAGITTHDLHSAGTESSDADVYDLSSWLHESGGTSTERDDHRPTSRRQECHYVTNK